MIEHILANVKSVGVFTIFLSILIIVHEWGHFITARKVGVAVEKFSIGFGPKLFSKMHKGTEFLICAIPLGGYVKMKGDERSDCMGTNDEYFSKPPGKRAWIIFNGAFVNYILAYVCLFIVFLVGYPGITTQIAKVIDGGPAQAAGLQSGDTIVEIDSHKIYGSTSLRVLLEDTTKESLDIKVLRDDKKMDVTVIPRIEMKEDIFGQEKQLLDLGVSFTPSVVGGLVEGDPAQKAGLFEGDKIVGINGYKTEDWEDIQRYIQQAKGKEIIVSLERLGQEADVLVSPVLKEMKDENGEMVSKKIIGIIPTQHLESYRFGLVDSFVYSFNELMFITKMTYKSLFKMVTGSLSPRKMSGPVGIFFIVKGAAEEGLSHFIFILGVISASLAIFNLLPLMPLDGGHMLLLAVEKIRGKALPEKVDEWIAKIGFSLIILLALFVFYSDFEKFGLIAKIRSIFP